MSSEIHKYEDKESVFLGLMDHVWHSTESTQKRWWSASGFSAEDMPSNLIGFYKVVRGFLDDTANSLCEVLSMQESQAVWNAGGIPSHGKPNAWTSNHYAPEYFNNMGCHKCNGKVGKWPTEFDSIPRIQQNKPLAAGRRAVFWRPWVYRYYDDMMPPPQQDGGTYDEHWGLDTRGGRPFP